MGFFRSSERPHTKAIERIKNLDRRLALGANFDELDLSVQMVGSETYQPVEDPFAKGEMSL